MRKTTYQVPELRDENDNVIQEGTFGKKSAFVSSSNDGAFDYILNDLEALHDAQTDSASTFTTAALTVTGTTSVPTANSDNNSKTIANTAFVKTAIANLVNGAPSQLDTLHELSTALGNDANFSATVTKEIGEKLDKAGGAITGPILYDKTPNDDTELPNKAYVDSAIANLVGSAPTTLDTLQKLATALGNDANFSATVANEIGEKVSKSGDTITGPILYDKTPNDDSELINKAYADKVAKAAEDKSATDADTKISTAHNYIKRNTAYKVGDILESPNLPHGYLIVVTQEGTTGSSEPDWTTIKNSVEMTDGGLKGVIRKVIPSIERHEASEFNIENGTNTEGTATYYLKIGRLVYVYLSGILTKDGTSQVKITGLPKPAGRVNTCLFSNKSFNCIGLFSIDDAFFSLYTGQIEDLYGFFSYIVDE